MDEDFGCGCLGRGEQLFPCEKHVEEIKSRSKSGEFPKRVMESILKKLREQE